MANIQWIKSGSQRAPAAPGPTYPYDRVGVTCTQKGGRRVVRLSISEHAMETLGATVRAMPDGKNKHKLRVMLRLDLYLDPAGNMIGFVPKGINDTGGRLVTVDPGKRSSMKAGTITLSGEVDVKYIREDMWDAEQRSYMLVADSDLGEGGYHIDLRDPRDREGDSIVLSSGPAQDRGAMRMRSEPETEEESLYAEDTPVDTAPRDRFRPNWRGG